MESGGTQGNGELIDSEERRAVGGDNTIEAAALQAAPKDIDGASDGNVWKHRSGRPFSVNQTKKKPSEVKSHDVLFQQHWKSTERVEGKQRGRVQTLSPEQGPARGHAYLKSWMSKAGKSSIEITTSW